MIKKQITVLASLGVLSAVAPLAVSCGFDTNKILTRTKADTSTLNYYYQYTPQHWSSGTTYNTNDAIMLSDLVGTLVASDKYNRAFGDLAIDKNLSDTSVGEPTDSDNKQWSYYINPQAKWFNADGTVAGNITAQDLVNTAKYVAYPGNGSQVLGLWTELVKGIAEINKILSSATNPAEELLANYWDDTNHGAYVINYKDDADGSSKSITVAELWDPNTLGFGVGVDPTDEYKVTFTLRKSAYYFDDLMQYLGFAPMPSKALPLGPNYDKQENILYSGAYLYKELNATDQYTYVKNPNYVHAAQTYIDTLKFINMTDAEASTARTLFEAGDLDMFGVSQSDSTGWDRYVGPDVRNPIFSGASSQLSPDAMTYTFSFNFSNQKMINSADSAVKKEAALGSLALQIPEVRQFIATHLNRSLFLKYYSAKTDIDVNTSSWLRNVYTPPNFAEDNSHTDYVNYLAQQYATNVLGDSTKVDEASAVLADGHDAFLNNDQLFGGITKEQIHEIIKSKLGVDRISLDYLMNGAQKATLNLSQNDMLKDFNSQFGDVININADVTIDNVEFQTRSAVVGDFSLSSSGWGPDYGDPMTFLRTYTLGGDLEANFGASKLFGTKLQLVTDDSGASSTTAPALTAADLDDSYRTVFEGLGIDYETIVNNWYNDMKDFTDKVYAADLIQGMGDLNGDPSARFEDQSAAEFEAIYQKAFFLPFYVTNGSNAVTISYTLPKSVTTIPYGTSEYKHWGVKVSDHLLNKAERDAINRRYEQELAIVNANPGALMEDYY